MSLFVLIVLTILLAGGGGLVAAALELATVMVIFCMLAGAALALVVYQALGRSRSRQGRSEAA